MCAHGGQARRRGAGCAASPGCVGVRAQPAAPSCVPGGICRKRKVGMAKSASLSLKQAVKACPVVLHKVFDFTFDGKPREKAHHDPFECLTVVAHFLLVSTCVTKSSDPTSLGTRLPCVTYSENPTLPLGRKSLLPCLLAGGAGLKSTPAPRGPRGRRPWQRP